MSYQSISLPNRCSGSTVKHHQQIPEVVAKLDAHATGIPAQKIQGSQTNTPLKPPLPNATPLTSATLARSQLRYAAYDRPETNTKPGVHSFSTLSTSSRRSTSQASSTKARLGDEHVDMTKTITAGDLALAEASEEGLLLSVSRNAAGVNPLKKGNHKTKTPKKDELV